MSWKAFLGVWLLTALLAASLPAQAAPGATTLYVDAAAGNDANPGSAAAPLRTLARANALVANGAGDTVYVRTGLVYAEPLIPAGFARDVVTYRAWTLPGDDPLRLPPVIDSPTGENAFTLIARHDITLDGFYVRNPGNKWGVIRDSHHITIVNCFFDQDPAEAQANFVYSGLDITDSSHHITLRNNRFNRWGLPVGTNREPGDGDMLWVMGLPKNRQPPDEQNPGSHHILLDGNFFSGFDPASPRDAASWGRGAHAGHALLNIEGRWNVVRNNVFFNLSQKNVDAIGYVDRRSDPQLNGVHDGTRLLFEGNIFRQGTATTNPAGGGGLGLGLAMSNAIVRFNLFDSNERAGLQIGAWGDEGASEFLVPAISGNHVYHNTFYHNGYVPDLLDKPNEDAVVMFDFRPQGLLPKNSHNNDFRNNLFYDNAGGISDDGWTVQEGTTQMWFYLRDDSGAFGLNQNFIISNLFYRAAGAASNEILIHAGLSNEPVSWLPGSYRPAERYHLPADEWNTQGGALLGNEWLIRANAVADPQLDLNTFAPAANSPARGSAWALAYATNAGAASLTLAVNDAAWFSDGFDGLVQPDAIRLGNAANSPVVRIAAVNYAANSLTLTEPATWDEGAQLYLATKSDGAGVLAAGAPDIGAVQGETGSATATPTATPAPPAEENLLVNGDFSQGESGWAIGGPGMSYSLDGRLCLHFAHALPNVWDAQVSQGGLALQQGRRYRLRATLWSRQDAAIKLIVGENQPPWANYWNQFVDLPAGRTQNFSAEFRMTTANTLDTGLFFQVGGHASPQICLDDATLTPTTQRIWLPLLLHRKA